MDLQRVVVRSLGRQLYGSAGRRPMQDRTHERYKLQAVEKWFGDVQVIKGVDLEISNGEFVVFVGLSGCN